MFTYLSFNRMKLFKHIIITILFGSYIIANSFGYLRIVEVSICMDDCSNYMLEGEDSGFITFLANPHDIDLSYYIDRYVQIEDGGEYQCNECSAMIIENVDLSTDCENPVACFEAPCSVAMPCELNTPVDCIDNYCGGCYADFYDLNGNLVDCYNLPIEECSDLQDIFFGWCDMWMGFAYVSGQCQGVSGCGWVVDGIDYTDAFFNSLDECEDACENGNQFSCSQIENEYESLHSGYYDNCIEDSDCVSVWGDCGVGLGGCHYSVNIESFNFEYSDELVDMWVNGDCMEWVCDCMPLPNSICTNGECELTYCNGPNPSGCFQEECSDGFDCVDFGNSGYADFCIPSSCDCEEDYIYNAYWFCTEDCNGGSCIPQNPQTGDLCVAEETSVGPVPGFIDCDGQCMDYQYYAWVGDGWCDDGWGYSFNCEALNFDEGDCVNNCNSGDINEDETINVLDIVLIVECILDADNDCNCSDINQDGEIDVIDIVLLITIILDR